MPADPTLRHLFDAPQPDSPIDVAAVVRRSRARRAPKVALTAGASVLAIGGLLFGGVQYLGGLSPVTMADAGAAPEALTEYGADEDTMSQADDGFFRDEVKRAAASDMNTCGEPVATAQPSESGLVLTVNFPDAVADGGYLIGDVTLTNEGTESWSGYTDLDPTVTLARDGIVIWHSQHTAQDTPTAISLEPGQSVSYEATVMAVVCGSADEGEGGFRVDLPAAPAGDYQVSAALDLLGDFDAQLITGPAQTITLR
jgi:hypothetical protein